MREHNLKDRHEDALSELERYKILVENVKDYAIFLLDNKGYVQTWNKGAERIKGYAPHEIIGKHFSTFYRHKDIVARKPDIELEQANEVGRVEDEDWRVRKDGSQFWANVVITALFDKNGGVIGYAKVTRDLTNRKFQEDALRKANLILKQQQKELQFLNSSKDEFISLASHQLRTPATSIKQYLGMILEGFVGQLTPTQIDFVEKAFASNERQINIVDNLLKVAQIDAGKVVLRKVFVSVDSIIKSIVDEYKETFHQREQKVNLDISDNIGQVSLDPTHFRMALDNLIDNASKYTPEGGSISISLKRVKDCIHIVIEDSGVGIAMENMDKLFVKFSRIPNELSNSVGGTGLGLYWVHKVIELHGGTIEVNSKPGKGSKFTVIMPIKE